MARQQVFQIQIAIRQSQLKPVKCFSIILVSDSLICAARCACILARAFARHPGDRTSIWKTNLFQVSRKIIFHLAAKHGFPQKHKSVGVDVNH